MTELSPVELRQIDLANKDHESLDSMELASLAAFYGKDESTICRDRKSDTYKAERERLGGSRRKRIASKSWDIVEKVINKGRAALEAREGDKIAEPMIERGARMAQWALDKMKEFDTGVPDDSSPVADLLARIYAADPEKDEMKRQIADLTARLDKYNGKSTGE